MNEKYLPIKELNESAYEFVLSIMKNPLEAGRYELENGAYAIVQNYVSKIRQNANYEAHKKYIDIQMVIDGCEIIAIESLETMYKYPVVKPYNEEKDVEQYAHNCEGVDYVLNSGDYMIIGPEDAHAPCINVGGPSDIYKVVLKVPVK